MGKRLRVGIHEAKNHLRMLVAQAQIEQLVIVAADAAIPKVGVPVVW